MEFSHLVLNVCNLSAEFFLLFTLCLSVAALKGFKTSSEELEASDILRTLATLEDEL